MPKCLTNLTVVLISTASVLLDTHQHLLTLAWLADANIGIDMADMVHIILIMTFWDEIR